MKGSKESARSATQRAKEDRLRMAAGSNDLETIRSLIAKKTNINAQEEVCSPPELGHPNSHFIIFNLVNLMFIAGQCLLVYCHLRYLLFWEICKIYNI